MNRHTLRKSQRGSKRLMHLMKRAQREMAPHMEKFTSPSNEIAFVQLSGIAAIVAAGQESEEYLKAATKQVSESTGIPLSAVMAHAECNRAMMTEMQSRFTPPIVGGRKNA